MADASIKMVDAPNEAEQIRTFKDFMVGKFYVKSTRHFVLYVFSGQL